MTYEEETKACLEELEANAKLPEGRICDSPEDIAEAEAINREMEVVSRKARNMFARSAELARGLILDRSR